MNLNPASPVPLYRQLADWIAARIDSGEFPLGAKIPSEPALAERFSLGRPTVRQATDVLVQRGLLGRRRGSGTFVVEPPRAVDLFSLTGTTASFRAQGVELNTRVLGPVARVGVATPHDSPFAGRDALSLTRVGSVGKRPVLVEQFLFDPAVFATLEGADLTGRSLARMVADEFFLAPARARQAFSVALARGVRARALGVRPGTPVLRVARTLEFEHAGNALFAELHCRTEQFAFSQTIGAVA